MQYMHAANCIINSTLLEGLININPMGYQVIVFCFNKLNGKELPMHPLCLVS